MGVDEPEQELGERALARVKDRATQRIAKAEAGRPFSISDEGRSSAKGFLSLRRRALDRQARHHAAEFAMTLASAGTDSIALIPDLKDRVVLITGASTGIGAAAARAFGRSGARVAINFRSSQSEAEGVAEAVRQHGGQAVLVQADVTEPDAANRVVRRTVEAFGRLDALINNAGALIRRTPIAEYTEDYVDALLDLNVKPVVRFTREAVVPCRPRAPAARSSA